MLVKATSNLHKPIQLYVVLILAVSHRRTNPWPLVCYIFFMVAYHILNTITAVFPPYTQKCLSLHMHRAKAPQSSVVHMYSKIGGPQYGTWFRSPFWHPKFGGDSQIFRMSVDLCCNQSPQTFASLACFQKRGR